MRLIDADIFIEDLGLDEENARKDNLGKIVTIEDFDRQGTAFDMEKVIERLQTELTLADEEKKRCIKENSLQFDTVKGYAQGIAVAIEIVKSGIGSKDEK